MKTDKELLELAAKAMGIKVIGQMGDDGLYLFNGDHWNPLTNDGDALRLAVKLNFQVSCSPNGSCEVVGMNDVIYSHEQSENNPCSATRRAIVRAAAAIGEEK